MRLETRPSHCIFNSDSTARFVSEYQNLTNSLSSKRKKLGTLSTRVAVKAEISLWRKAEDRETIEAGVKHKSKVLVPVSGCAALIFMHFISY